MSETALLPLRGPIRRILVLRPRALGDVLLVTPALRALRAGFPHAELHVAIDDVLASLLRRNPRLDRLWLLPRRRPHGAAAWLPIYRGFAGAGFDLVIDFHGSPRTASLAWLTRAPNRVGYALRGRGRFYNLRLPRDADRSGRRRMLYAAQTNLEIVARCGVDGATLSDPTLEFVPDPAIDARLAQWLGQELPRRPRVGLSPIGTWPAKTWPLTHWVRAATLLADAGCGVLLLWGPGERDGVEAVAAQLPGRAKLAPPTDIDELAGLLAGLDLVVCNDSGLKHLAVARGTPTLTLYGPTNPVAWGPPHGPHRGLRVELPCVACNRSRCSHTSCMRLLDPEVVARQALARLAAAGEA